MPATIVDRRQGVRGQKIVYYGDGVGPPARWSKAAADQFSKDTGINVTFTQRPQDSTEALALFQRFFQGQSSDIDAMSIDVVWPGHPRAAPGRPELRHSAMRPRSTIPGIVANNTVDGKLVAMPYFSDFGMLYYRTDLLQKYGFTAPPKTWDELSQQATKSSTARRAPIRHFGGFVFQGKAYEGLTCNGAGVAGLQRRRHDRRRRQGHRQQSAGGRDAEHDQGLDRHDRRRAASPRYQEEDARNAFQGGNAAFMRNWPYAYALGQAAKTHPSRASSTSRRCRRGPASSLSAPSAAGVWPSRSTPRVPDASIEFIRYLSSPEFQTFRGSRGRLRARPSSPSPTTRPCSRPSRTWPRLAASRA